MTDISPIRSQQQQFIANNDQQEQEPTVAKRLDDWDAFIVLFAISFGPAFVAVDLTVNQTTSD